MDLATSFSNSSGWWRPWPCVWHALVPSNGQLTRHTESFVQLLNYTLPATIRQMCIDPSLVGHSKSGRPSRATPFSIWRAIYDIGGHERSTTQYNTARHNTWQTVMRRHQNRKLNLDWRKWRCAEFIGTIKDASRLSPASRLQRTEKWWNESGLRRSTSIDRPVWFHFAFQHNEQSSTPSQAVGLWQESRVTV